MTCQTHGRRTLLAGTALAATLGFAGWTAPAMAQIAGTVTSTTGTNLTIGATNVTDITITQPEAIINWNVSGGPTATDVAFLPLANSVLYHEGPTAAGPFPGTDYTVLNRVFPVTPNATGGFDPITATVNVGGTVNATFAGKQGGNVWFYSPHGIITSGNASFNVGSLLLTASDIDTSSGSLYVSQAVGNQIGFLAATDPNAKVQIGKNTTISALGNNTSSIAGYVGIFAPRVEQGGSVRAGGMVGYAAGEAGTMTFNAGLVDIVISQGTAETGGNGIVHTGTTGGPAVTATTTRQIQMVAIPKNTALTMLLGGSIGFDAGTAVPDGSAVVLSSGWQAISTPADIAQGLGNMRINDAVISGDPQVWATGTLTVAPLTTGTGLTRFSGFTEFNVGRQLTMTAGPATLIDFTGNLVVNALRQGTGENVRITTAGDPLNILAPGKIAVASDLFIDATGQTGGALAVPPVTGANGVGGNVQVLIDKGSLTIGGDFSITANGFGQDGTQTGGNGIGGSIDVRVSGGGSITGAPVQPPATVLPVPVGFAANGVAGSASGDASVGGTGTGGVITLRDDGGTLDFGSVSLLANGTGSTSTGVNPTVGDGLGGQISVTISGQAQTWDTLSIDASALSGSGFGLSGNAIGNLGGAKLQVTGTGQLTVSTLAILNEASISAGDTGTSTATAGGIDLLVNAGGKLNVTGATVIDASGSSFDQQVGGSVTGGTINATVDGAGSSWQFTDIAINAEGTRVGSASAGSTATGGQINIGATNGGLIQVNQSPVAPFTEFLISAASHLGYGPAANTSQGGTARLYVQGGTIDASLAVVRLSGAGMADAPPYDGSNVGVAARGGTASVELLSGGIGAGAITTQDLLINAKGEAVTVQNSDPYNDFTGPFTAANLIGVNAAGNGQGGTAQLLIQSGTLTAGTVAVHASGLGGSASYTSGATAWQSGNGTGGLALVNQSGGTANLAGLDVLAQGRGGSLTDPLATFGLAPLAGNGFGGTARATFSGGSMAVASTLAVRATALGGNGTGATINAASTSSTAGGFADAGLSLAELLMPNGSTANVTALTTVVDASATGGAGGGAAGFRANGGAALAGTARASLADAAFDLGNLSVIAGARGGSGGTGGNATGGTAAFLLVDTVATPATNRQINSLLLTGTPFGGTGQTADGTATAGTTKLTVRAGRAASALVIRGGLSADALGTATPGDGFTGNFGSVPVQVGLDFVVNTSRDINMSVDAGGGVNAGGQIRLTSPGAITTLGSGVLSAAQTLTVLAGRSINMGGLSAGSTTRLITADPVTGLDGPVTVQSLTSGGLVTVSGSTVSISSPGSLSFQSAGAFGGNLTINTAQNLTMGGTSTSGRAILTAGGNLALNGTASATAGFALQAGGNITTVSNITTFGSFSAVALGTYTGALPLIILGNVSIDAAGGISIPSGTTVSGAFVPAITSGGTTFLRAANAPIVLSLSSTGAVTLAARSATITSPGALTFANATSTAGDLFITTGGALTLGGASSPAVLSLTAPALVSINGAVAGQTIRISSPDIAVSATGRLGQRGLTNTILLTNTAPARGTLIGGTGQQGVWSLDGAEAARLFAEQEIAILPGATAATNAGTLTVGSLALTYGTGSTTNLGPGGQFVVSTPGPILVNGQVNLTAATNADTLFLSGGTIDVVTDNGGIALAGAGGALLGTLELNADAIRVGTASALSALSGLTSVDAASKRLDANDGLVNQSGTIRSGALVVSFNSRFFIQNSGAGTQFDLRRGFAANTLAISTDSRTAQIAINGVLFGSGQLTGGLTQRGVTINGLQAAAGGAFDPLSTINGCVIGRDCGSTPVGEVVPPQETIDGLVGPIGPGSSIFVLPVIQFGEMPLFDSPPLIDEPVTGVGNDDLWQQR